MKNAKVFLLEVDEGIMEMAIASMKPDHQVALTAHDYFEAQKAYQLTLDKGVNVAVIDSSPDYAQEIAELLKRVNPEIKIVAFGYYQYRQKPEWGNIIDAWVDKDTNPGGLGKAIANL